MEIQLFINEYVDSKKLAWARSSQKNERSRLRYHGPHVLDDPLTYYNQIKGKMKANSIRTTFFRLGKLHEWMVENDKIPPSKNPWKKFLSDNALQFKHAYDIEVVTVTFDEAKNRISTLEEPYRSASFQLLEAGLRYCELRTFDGDKVIGKGSKPRSVFLRQELKKFKYNGSYSALYVRLKALGLKPHTLRKLCATEFSRHPDVKDQDICKMFGWGSIETSIKYRQPHNDSKMREMLQGVVASAKPEHKAVDIRSFIAKFFDKVKV